MKPNTHFRTVPVTERLPEKEGYYFFSDNLEVILRVHYVPEKSDTWIKTNFKFYVEELPEQAEPTDEEIEKAASDYMTAKVSEMKPFNYYTLHEAYQAAAKDCRDGKIVKPKE